MTAPSTPDLAARILAAIDETERLARAATPGPWNHDPNGIAEWSVYGAAGWMVAMAKAYADGVAQMPNAAANRKHPPQRIDAVANAVHISLNDPPTVLRRCAADRRTVERHQRDVQLDVPFYACDGTETRRDVEYCLACTIGAGCDHCVSWNGESELDEAAVLWPCPTIRDLAEVYGITEEG